MAATDGRGYADGHTDILDDDEAEGAAEQEFVAEWWTAFRSKRIAAKEILDIATEAGINFRQNALNLTGRATELGQEILPRLAGFVYDIDTDDGLYSLQIRKMRGRRGARATWAVVPVDAKDPKGATPTTPATP